MTKQITEVPAKSAKNHPENGQQRGEAPNVLQEQRKQDENAEPITKPAVLDFFAMIDKKNKDVAARKFQVYSNAVPTLTSVS